LKGGSVAVARKAAVAVEAVAIRHLDRQPRHQADHSGDDQDRAHRREIDPTDVVADREPEDGSYGSESYRRTNGHTVYVPRFWIFMQVVILICLLASMVIAIIKL
jgi:hypothetical protein